MKYLPILLGAIGAMYFIGTLAIFSIGYASGENGFFGIPSIFLKQLISLLLGCFCFQLIQLVELQTVKKISWILLFLSFCLILLLFVPPLRVEVGHNKNWIRLGSGFQIEPIEYFKGAFILWFAYMCSVMKDRKTRFHIYSSLVLLAVTVVIISLGDLGNLTMLFTIFPLLLYFTNANIFSFLVYILFLPFFIAYVFSARISRFMSLFDTKQNSHSNYQAMQSLRAIQHGGLIGSGDFVDVKHLPDASTDYIFSVILNQFGALGFITVVLILIIVLATMIGMAMHVKNIYGRVLILGLFLWILVNDVCNMLICLNMLPVFGVPFIFLSYGGSYNIAFASMLSVAILAYRKQVKE